MFALLALYTYTSRFFFSPMPVCISILLQKILKNASNANKAIDPAALTRKPANEVMNPSFVNSHVPPYSSSSICWKLLKYKYVIPALTTTNLKHERRHNATDNIADLQAYLFKNLLERDDRRQKIQVMSLLTTIEL